MFPFRIAIDKITVLHELKSDTFIHNPICEKQRWSPWGSRRAYLWKYLKGSNADEDTAHCWKCSCLHSFGSLHSFEKIEETNQPTTTDKWIVPTFWSFINRRVSRKLQGILSSSRRAQPHPQHAFIWKTNLLNEVLVKGLFSVPFSTLRDIHVNSM